jgi:cytochrome c5
MRQTIIIIVLGIFSVVSISTVLSSSEEGEREDEERYEYDADDHDDGAFGGAWLESRADVRPVANATYDSECGSCHFAYQPGLLPEKDWERIMDALAEHYGDDASLDERQAADIRGYLRDNAADRASLSRARAFAAGSEASEGLPRVTTTSYFRREHAEIPARFVQGNAEVASFGNCSACHRNAAAGVYNEHQVVIPGVGKWDD